MIWKNCKNWNVSKIIENIENVLFVAYNWLFAFDCNVFLDLESTTK